MRVWFQYEERCVNPWSDETHDVECWYWQDDECVEPIGPFDTEAEARADYHAIRDRKAGE